MNKLYDLITFHNNTTPALNEDNLNAMSQAIDNIDDRVVEIAGDVLEVVPQIQTYLAQAESLVEALETLSQNPPYIGQNGNWYVFDTNTESYVDSGIDASITVDIADVTMLPEGSSPYITNTGTSTDPIFHLFIPIGATGAAGNGIVSITKTSSVGLVDTYTILYTNGSTDTFTVTNGSGGGASALSQLSDVSINLVADGNILRYNSTTQKWENVSLSKSDVGLENVDNTSDLNKPISTATQTALNAKADADALKVTDFEVTTTGWTSDTTSQSGTTLYKKQISLNHVYANPSVDIGAASGYTLPTVAEQEAYDLLLYVTVDTAIPCLYLYASDIPTDGFYINVEGVD